MSPIFRPVPLPRPSANSDVSFGMLNFYRLFFLTQPPFKHLSITSFPAPKSRDHTLLPGPTLSLQPSTSVKRGCLGPCPGPFSSNRSTRPGHGRLNHRHRCRPATATARRLAASRFLLQEVERSPTKIQCVRRGAPGNLRGRAVLLSHAGGPAFHHPDGPQTVTFAFPQKRDKCSPRQFNHLDFIS